MGRVECNPECEICGHSFDPSQNEYCPNCNGDEHWQDDDKETERDAKNNKD